MMILMSQAYVLRRIWGKKTNNKSYLRYLLKSWIPYLFIKNNFRIFLHEHGVVSDLEFFNFREKSWKRWLKCLNRYNLSPNVWYRIMPQQWRFRVSEHWETKKNRVLSTEENKIFNIYQQDKKLSISIFNSSFERTRKRNKLFSNNLSTYSYFDLNKNLMTKKFSKSKENYVYNNTIKDKTRKFYTISDKKRISPSLLISRKNILFGYNLLLWFIPEFIEQKSVYQYEKVLKLDTSIIKNKDREILRNKDLLRERELNKSIRQWRWKSKNSEKKFGKLGNMASLMTFMQNQETMVSLSEKMKEDLDSFRFFFRRNNSFNRLTINSEHRLPRLLDDQIYIYKLVNTLSNFRQRLKGMPNPENLNKYLINIHICKNGGKKNLFLFNSFNLEDILLPKRRREFRILNSLSLQEERHIKLNENLLKRIKERNQKIEMTRNKIIKRFIWSSYRFEDLACMNRFWFSTMNGSRFSILRFRIYPTI